MATETERKFLVVSGDFKSSAIACSHIVQGYLSSHPERTVRIRIEEKKAFLTIKGSADEKGMSRYEWEKEILREEAEELLLLCEPGIIEKTRYLVPAGKHFFQVDEFAGDNKGLVMAEIELEDEDDRFEKPGWLGKEVTNDSRFYNAMLKKHPYTQW